MTRHPEDFITTREDMIANEERHEIWCWMGQVNAWQPPGQPVWWRYDHPDKNLYAAGTYNEAKHYAKQRGAPDDWIVWQDDMPTEPPESVKKIGQPKDIDVRGGHDCTHDWEVYEGTKFCLICHERTTA